MLRKIRLCLVVVVLVGLVVGMRRVFRNRCQLLHIFTRSGREKGQNTIIINLGTPNQEQKQCNERGGTIGRASVSGSELLILLVLGLHPPPSPGQIRMINLHRNNCTLQSVKQGGHEEGRGNGKFKSRASKK